MASNSVLNAVQHYQRSIERSPTDVARLLHCVGKLYKIPITVEHLQQTGVGRTVNALRKHEGELGVAAEAVVNKWKQLVAAESDIRAGNQSSENEQEVDDDEDDNNSERNVQANYNDSVKTQTTESTSARQHSHSHSANQAEKSKNDTEHSKDSSRKHHKSSSSSHKTHDRHSHTHHKSEHRDKSKGLHSNKDSHKKDEREHKAHKSQSKSEGKEKGESAREKNSKDDPKSKPDPSTYESSRKQGTPSNDKVEQHTSNGKHKHHEKHHSSKEKDKSKSKSKSSSEHKSQCDSPNMVKSRSARQSSTEPSTSAAAIVSKTSSPPKKRRHEDEEDKGSSPKKPKSNIHHNEKSSKQSSDNTEGGDMEDGIDSSMGANFADVLGMLNMPKKKAKKSLSALKNTSPKSAKKTSKNDSSKSSSTSKVNGIRNTEMPSTSSSSSTSQRKLEKKPDLLNSKVKLPPLDPSIALELPIISNNYKPLPLNPTVMDCVFNSTTSSSSRAPPPRLLSDAEALSHGISSKTMRTKVYSGVKTGQLLQVPTLFDLCIRILQKNIDALEYTGGVPFDVLRPVLERATPQQLFTFEEYNPYLMEDSDVLWKQHVQRNYRSHKREEMETWREMFMRCQEDQERRLSMLAENIKQSQKAIALPVRKTQLAFVDSMVKPPRNVVRKQEQYGTKSKLVATPAARVAALCSVTPNAAKQGDARLRVAAAFAQDPARVASAPIRPKKAPLMAKTLQFMRGRLKR